MTIAQATRTQSKYLSLYRSHCDEKSTDFDCSSYVTMILYASAVLSDLRTFKSYLDNSDANAQYGGGVNDCSLYVANDDRAFKAYRLERFAALVYIQDALGKKVFQQYAINAYLCAAFLASNKAEEMLPPPAPGYPSKPIAILELARKQFGQPFAAQLEQFQEQIIDPYFQVLTGLRVAEGKRTKGDIYGPKHHALALELNKNARAEAVARKFPQTYIDFLDRISAYERKSLKFSSEYYATHR
jgi:hypothetical protein